MSGRSPDAGPDVAGARSVLFVCLGNICRSPLAKGVFAQMAGVRGTGMRLRADSCGTGGWHVGSPADPRTVRLAQRMAVPLSHTARQFDPRSDPDSFDLFIAMDRSNLRELERLGCPKGRTHLFLRFADPSRVDARDEGALANLEIPDPYTGGEDGFERVYRLVQLASDGLLSAMLRG